MAWHAVRLAVEMMEEDDGKVHAEVVLEPKLVVRGATAGPRAAPEVQRSTSVVSR
jgi:hypothetical protein